MRKRFGFLLTLLFLIVYPGRAETFQFKVIEEDIWQTKGKDLLEMFNVEKVIN